MFLLFRTVAYKLRVLSGKTGGTGKGLMNIEGKGMKRDNRDFVNATWRQGRKRTYRKNSYAHYNSLKKIVQRGANRGDGGGPFGALAACQNSNLISRGGVSVPAPGNYEGRRVKRSKKR